jgi:hypothetical protein
MQEARWESVREMASWLLADGMSGIELDSFAARTGERALAGELS